MNAPPAAIDLIRDLLDVLDDCVPGYISGSEPWREIDAKRDRVRAEAKVYLEARAAERTTR
jgi:hypothetical protein